MHECQTLSLFKKLLSFALFPPSLRVTVHHSLQHYNIYLITRSHPQNTYVILQVYLLCKVAVLIGLFIINTCFNLFIVKSSKYKFTEVGK